MDRTCCPDNDQEPFATCQFVKDLPIYFTYSSSFSYLAWVRLQQHPDRYASRSVQWTPINFLRLSELMGLPPKPPVDHQLAYNQRDAKRWAQAYGVAFETPVRRFGPTQDAVKGHLMAQELGPETERAWMKAVFTAYRQQGRDLSDRGMLAELAHRVGLPTFLERVDEVDLERRLEANTQSALRAGAPGVPFTVLDGEGFWGNDRLAWVEARLAGNERPAHV